jgi:hypothetical protein
MFNLDKTAARLTGRTARVAIAAAGMALIASLMPSPAHAARGTRCEVDSQWGSVTTYRCTDENGNRYRMECDTSWGETVCRAR